MFSGLYGGDEDTGGVAADDGDDAFQDLNAESALVSDYHRASFLSLCTFEPLTGLNTSLCGVDYDEKNETWALVLKLNQCGIDGEPAIAELLWSGVSMKCAALIHHAFERASTTEAEAMVNTVGLLESVLATTMVYNLKLEVKVPSSDALHALLERAGAPAGTKEACDHTLNVLLTAVLVGDAGVGELLSTALSFKEVLPGVVNISSTQQELVAAAMFLFQECYESAVPGVRGAYVTSRAQVVCRFTEQPAGRFLYYTAWPGFNVPRSVVQGFLDAPGVLEPVEAFVAASIARTLADPGGDYYVTASVVGDRFTYIHEVAHALFNLDGAYRAGTTEAIHATLTAAERDTMVGKLLGEGYVEDVADDEIQAYNLTGHRLGVGPSDRMAAFRKTLARLFVEAMVRRRRVDDGGAQWDQELHDTVVAMCGPP